MRNPAYFFQSLESVYYFRMRVPTDLQPIFKRTGSKKSLRTKSKTVALRRCRQYVANGHSAALASRRSDLLWEDQIDSLERRMNLISNSPQRRMRHICL